MLDADELKRRIEAARILRSMKQTDLAELMHQDGLGKHDLGRIERGDMTMQRVHRDALVRHLRVPEWWFTSDDVDVVVGLAPPPSLSPEETRGLLARLLMDLDPTSDRVPRGTQTPPGAEGRQA